MLSIKDRFIANSNGFLRRFWPFLILYFISLAADGLSTICFMLRDGSDGTEMHPAVSIAARMFGPVLGPLLGVLGKAVAGLIVAVYWRRIAWAVLLVPTILSFWAAWYNCWGWQYYQPSIYIWWPF